MNCRPFVVGTAVLMFACCAQGGDLDVGLLSIELQRPMPYEVVQREGFQPSEAHVNRAGGQNLGFANVSFRGTLKDVPDGVLEARVIPTQKKGEGTTAEWRPIEGKASAGKLEATVRVPAGGWYRLEVRCRGKNVVALGNVEPVGVGEVFIVAGQSYATNCNDEQLKVADPEGRVVAFDSARGKWGVANDPQPAPDNSDGGSIWPPLGDTLLPISQVPIGFANVAWGATSSEQWMPEGKLFPRLVDTGKRLGRFRAVLWQQGESDVIAKTPTEVYVERLKTVRETAAKAWGFEPTWLLAKSTLHPTVYNDPAGEGRIRKAIDELCQTPGFRPGPDTDILGGENRGPNGSRRHFSGIGQRRAALMWYAAIWHEMTLPGR